jgi:hypothetical protein
MAETDGARLPAYDPAATERDRYRQALIDVRGTLALAWQRVTFEAASPDRYEDAINAALDTIARAALAPQPAEKQATNRAESVSERPEGPGRANGAGVPETDETCAS